MRLGEIAEILRSVDSKLEITVESGDPFDESIYQIHNLNSVREGVSMLQQTGLFRDQISPILSSDIFNTVGDYLRVGVEAGNTFRQSLSFLKTLSSQLRIILTEIIGLHDSPNAIYVKFPAVRDFDDVGKNASRFQQILSQVILDPEIGGEIKIESVETGSIWFKVIVGTSLAVQLIGATLRSAAIIMRDFKQNSLVDEYVQQQKIVTEEKQNFLAFQKKLMDFYVEKEAQNIDSFYFAEPDPNNERMGRLMKAIKDLSELIREGADIQPSLLNSPEIKNEFPDLKNLPSIESKTKSIENGNRGERGRRT